MSHKLHTYYMAKVVCHYFSSMSEGGGQGGQLPPQILAYQMAPPGSGSRAPHYYLPPQIFRLCDMPVFKVCT